MLSLSTVVLRNFSRFVAAEYEAFVRALKHDHLIVTAAGNSGCNIDEHEGC